MKSLAEYINESEDQIKLKPASHDGYAHLMNVDATALLVIAEAAKDWLANPNKSADFYKGDEGQMVANNKSDALSIAQYIIDNYDNVVNA